MNNNQQLEDMVTNFGINNNNYNNGSNNNNKAEYLNDLGAITTEFHYNQSQFYPMNTSQGSTSIIPNQPSVFLDSMIDENTCYSQMLSNDSCDKSIYSNVISAILDENQMLSFAVNYSIDPETGEKVVYIPISRLEESMIPTTTTTTTIESSNPMTFMPNLPQHLYGIETLQNSTHRQPRQTDSLLNYALPLMTQSHNDHSHSQPRTDHQKTSPRDYSISSISVPSTPTPSQSCFLNSTRIFPNIFTNEFSTPSSISGSNPNTNNFSDRSLYSAQMLNNKNGTKVIRPIDERNFQELPPHKKLKVDDRNLTFLSIQDQLDSLKHQTSSNIGMLNNEENKKSEICDVCHQKFKNRSGLGRHKLSHIHKTQLHCAFCTKRFILPQNYKQHLQTDHQNFKRSENKSHHKDSKPAGISPSGL